MTLTGVNSPTFQTNQVNGHSVVRLPVGGSAYLNNATASSDPWPPFSIFFVMRPLSDTADFHGLNQDTGGIGIYRRASDHLMNIDKQAVAAIVASTTARNTNVWYLTGLTATSDTSGTFTWWANGTSDGSGTGSLSTPASAGIALGAGRPSGTYFGAGEYAEILVYNRVLSASERATVDSYIQDTYGITVSDYSGYFGTLAVTNANDTVSMSATEAMTGSLGATNASDVVAFSGTSSMNIVGTLVVTAASDLVAIVGSSVSIMFSPPTHEEPIRTTQEPLKHYRLTWANSVVRVNGTLTSVRSPSQDLLTAAGVEGVDFFLGGRQYAVTTSTRDELTAAGFGSGIS